ncbi:L-lactate dehydrogenase [Marichromatium gracile]|uniref:L-lactate dehydrogenase n=1 Tax=Marichromatium gracile TaxID=1048 RepID=UPI001EEEF93B|nr:L-lactate dehydrogenase [Marichromatium gracile]MCF1183998.1 L-lactate dehydrogenase [Marichromatium gracile]
MLHPHTIGIVGTGQVGMAAAYALFQQRIANELILIDRDQARAEGEAMDLMHAQGYVGRRRVRAGDYSDLARAQIIIVTAGVAQRPGESRLELLQRNVAVFREIAEQLDRHAPEALLLIASNPVDLLTYAMEQLSSRPRHRVIGTGTMLDTTRLRTLLAEHFQVDPRSVHALILGEHGDSEFAVWSQANIGGTPIRGHDILGKRCDRSCRDALLAKVRGAAGSIIERKGYTNWAIGLVIAHLVRTIQEDQGSVLPVTTRLDGAYGLHDICLSIPVRVGIEGAGAPLPLPLDDEERAALAHSAEVLRGFIDGLGLG